jgi:hypothetical protein
LVLPLHNLGKTAPEEKVRCLTCGRAHAFEYPVIADEANGATGSTRMSYCASGSSPS